MARGANAEALGRPGSQRGRTGVVSPGRRTDIFLPSWPICSIYVPRPHSTRPRSALCRRSRCARRSSPRTDRVATRDARRPRSSGSCDSLIFLLTDCNGMSGTLSGLRSPDRPEVRNLWRVGETSGRRDRPFGRKEGARKKSFGRDRAQPLEKAHFAERNGKKRKLLESIFRLSRAFRKRSGRSPARSLKSPRPGLRLARA